MKKETYGKPISILLADDDEDDQKIFSDAIKDSFSDVCLNVVGNGNELLSMLMRAIVVPDILFLDINMPQKSGLQCLDEIKRIEALKDLPIIIYSTSSYHINIQETFDKGADIYFMKPNSFTSLISKLNIIFGIDWSRYKKERSFDTFVL